MEQGAGRHVAAAVAVALIALAMPAQVGAEGSLLRPWLEPGAPPLPWHVVGLPQQQKPYTRFSVVDTDGVRALRVEADRSYGNLVHPVEPAAQPHHLAWRWRIDRALPAADLASMAAEDTELRVCVSFDEPLDQVPFVERQLLRLARGRSAEPLPAATLCYVWSPLHARGSVLASPYTGRLRYMVLESGAASTMRAWVPERRDLDADFRLAFGHETHGTVPPVVGVVVGADADNTRAQSLAHVAELVLDR